MLKSALKCLKVLESAYKCSQNTVWKFQDFSITHILREINFGDSKMSKFDIFAIFGPLNLIDWVNLSFPKVQKFMKNQNSEPLNMSKWQILPF